MANSINTTTTIGVAKLSRPGTYQKIFKRLIDIMVVILVTPVAITIVLPLALIVSFDGSAPFYWQKRVGFHGRVFHMLKLRSMVPDAEKLLQLYLLSNPDAKREWDNNQKLKNDPRITWLGKIIRKTSIDELPQLWNVLRGEMSLVGPRPFMCDQRKLYPGIKYYEMLPGITGLWQISDRNDCSFSERARFDSDYHNKLSLKTDLAILFLTVGTVLRATGY